MAPGMAIHGMRGGARKDSKSTPDPKLPNTGVLEFRLSLAAMSIKIGKKGLVEWLKC
jgi:hypothetical protein